MTEHEHHPHHHGHHEHHKHEIFKVQIDKNIYEFDHPIVTGCELLTKAGKIPPEKFALYLKVPGGQPQRINLDEKVDLCVPGREKFVTLPLDQTEGLGTRRDFALPSEDMEWLTATGLQFELVTVAGIRRVVIRDWPIPAGYTVGKVDANVRIDPGYPDAQIDMVYFHPPLQRADGGGIKAICNDAFDGKNWQRWSRHRTGANPWRPGIDSLATHMALVQEWLKHELTKI